jgi:hypothetical protein
MNNLRSFIIKRKEGLNFSNISGDRNKIHIDNLAGYNSIFGTTICHGVLVIFKFFKIINIKKEIKDKKKFSISIEFKKYAIYDIPISFKSLNKSSEKNIYRLFQNKELVAIININNTYKEIENKIKKATKSAKIIPSKKFDSFYNKLNIKTSLGIILSNLSKYAGNIYPGENSIIKKIDIEFNIFKKNTKKVILINSKLVDKRLPLIKNRLTFENYVVNFNTLIRPKLCINFKKPNDKILKLINTIKDNILILGASSGIGFDLLNLFKLNKKIKIVSTYYKNKIKVKGKNIIKKHVDIEKDLYLIRSIIKKYSPIRIYYFSTPKININSRNSHLLNLYKKYYLNYPAQILNFSKKYNVKFFYPSTSYLDVNKKSNYSKIKFKAENLLLNFKTDKVKVNTLRIPEINTKQNLSLIVKKLPNFRDILFNNKKIQNSVFFK